MWVGSTSHGALDLHGSLTFIILKLVPNQLWWYTLLETKNANPSAFYWTHLVFDFSPALQARRVCIRKSSRNFYKKPKFGDLAESLWAHVVCTVVGGAEETSWYCVKKRGSLICFSCIFLAERKLDRKQPLGLFNLHCTITGNRAIIPFYRLNDQLATWLRVELFPFPHHTID